MTDDADADGRSRSSITSDMVSSGSTFDPADVESEDELRSSSKLYIYRLYQKLVEKEQAGAAAELSEQAGTYRLGETAARLSRKYLTKKEKDELGLPLRWR